MAYAGLPPATFTNNLTNVQLVDDISGSFNGSTQTFALTSSSAPFHAVSARSLIVVLGGIVQKPQVDYTVDGANITFTVAPVAGLTFAARNIYGLNYLNNVNDGVITPAKLSTGAPTWNTGGTVTVSGDLNVTGSFNSGTQGLFWGDNEPANFGDGNDLKIYHDGLNSYIDDSGTGVLAIRSNSVRLQKYTGEEMVQADADGSVILYYDNAKKFETTTSGTLTTGSVGIVNSNYFTGSYPWYINQDSTNGFLSINYYGNTDDFVIRDNNNIGIGTTNPIKKLQIGSITGTFQYTSTDALGIVSSLNPGISVRNTGNSSEFDLEVSNTASGMRMGSSTSHDFNLMTANQMRLTITSTGNVGIGTTNPDKKLRVEGDARITGTLTMGTASISINGAHEYPTIRPTLDLNFAATKTLDRRITFTRDSIGTYVDELGIIRTAPNNTPRFDHDPETGESLGLLIEESRTNIVTGVGGATASILTSGQTNELTKNNDAYLYQKNASSSAESPIGIPVSGSVSTTSFTYSAYVKPGTTNRIYFQTVANNLGDNAYHYFNIGLDSSTSIDYANSGNLTYTRRIEPLHSGWYRLSVTIFGFSDTSLYQSQVRIGSFTGGSSHVYSNTTDTFYFYGAQVEVGSFPTSYIPTSGSTVTRAQDIAKITGSNFTDFYNSSEGTLVSHYYSTVDDGYIAQLENSDTPGDDRIGFVNYVGYQGFVETGNSTQANLDNGIPTVGGFNKVAFAFKENDFAVSLNSATPVTDTSGTMPTVDRMMIGSRYNGQYDILKSTIKQLTYYPKRLPNAQLQGLTAQ